MSLDLTDDKSTLVQVMAWCRQATSHYLSQCWPRPLSPYGITRPWWVNEPCQIMKPSRLLHQVILMAVCNTVSSVTGDTEVWHKATKITITIDLHCCRNWWSYDVDVTSIWQYLWIYHHDWLSHFNSFTVYHKLTNSKLQQISNFNYNTELQKPSLQHTTFTDPE